MVFPGTLSSGCSLCRKRKVKCDERRPGCRRCEVYLATCPGYERPLVMRFHSEPGSSLTRDPLVANHQQIRRMRLLMRSNPTRQPQPSFEDESMAYFLQEYCVESGPGGFGGHVMSLKDRIMDLFQSSSHDSCLRQATLATSYITLSRHYKSSTLYFTARTHYGAALRAINKSLSGPLGTVTDEMLVTILFLGMIEDIDCADPDAKNHHMLAISRLCEATGRRLLSNVHKSPLDSWIFSELQIPSFNAKKSLYCFADPDVGLDTSNFFIDLALNTTRVSRFHRLAKHLTSLKTPHYQRSQRSLLVSAIRQALDIKSEVVKLSGSLPPRWMPWETDDKGRTYKESPFLINCTATWMACLCCRFNATLILFFSRVLSCCRALMQLDNSNDQSTPETLLAERLASFAEAQLGKLTALVCAVTPYLMGETDDQGASLAVVGQKAAILYRIIWPLAIVHASPHSTNQEVEDCLRRLNCIRDHLGIKLASVVSGFAQDLMA